jgi:hypothetical protein
MEVVITSFKAFVFVEAQNNPVRINGLWTEAQSQDLMIIKQ